MGKEFLDFITLDRKNSNPDFHGVRNKINYHKVLDNIPIPITLWELRGEDFVLVYSNNASEELIEPKLSAGIQLSRALPNEYKNIFSPISSNDGNNSSSQIMIDESLLLIFNNSRRKNTVNQNRDNYKKEPFKTIIEQSPVSIIITDTQGNIEFINPKFVEITGYSAYEIMGKNPRILKSGNKSSEE